MIGKATVLSNFVFRQNKMTQPFYFSSAEKDSIFPEKMESFFIIGKGGKFIGGMKSNLVTLWKELKEEKIKKLLATPIIALMKQIGFAVRLQTK